MFTGIVEEVGTVKHTRTEQSVMTLTIQCERILEDMHVGDSISVNGACLTVVDFTQHTFSVQVIHGTEAKTYLNTLSEGAKVNLERAMHAQGRFGGHFVLGHVDEVGRISHIKKNSNSTILTITASPQLISQLVPQGSIAVDGVSLTIFALYENAFDIHLIPETRHATILNEKQRHGHVHLEIDMLFKYVDRLMTQQPESEQSTLTQDKLQSLGF
ncbi:riboflavin synthase [Staphylococcus auricularis]|uniref:Riboflavin synthase n=1 Tax=Staphylococcus auricularis TaxID=29379 RepID=A0AAW7MC31_9STAP|nr:riboflavin synthase [Staphylococcus auricularis]MBM0868160.1 riboflavin synthase [Staphylococcus auricularis]MCG7341680.1 riboflavin synthase [Staphylococcus auricularis]MDC6326980.1 riboflavin synthase [Staphylococcus auricularis]MDN4532857.1 riboflavin synthase [Staphylococcus auricularis]HJE01896.1 riboflavin synthase [Staphylococcus auricularis]